MVLAQSYSQWGLRKAIKRPKSATDGDIRPKSGEILSEDAEADLMADPFAPFPCGAALILVGKSPIFLVQP
jgi:hypothetical protein